ncbi:MAG: amidohydrolase [Thermoplasmata archaeon]
MDGAVTFVGGRIFTGERYVESLLVEDGRVLAAGDRAAVRRVRPTGAETVDLHGGLALPGLIDAHYHVRDSALRDRSVDLRGARNLDELLVRLRDAARLGVGPLLGYGWDVEAWPTHAYPTRDDLDRAVDGRPVAIFRACGHVAAVNSAAVDRLHLEPPVDGRTDERWGRDPRGRFNGILEEDALRHLRPLLHEVIDRAPDAIVENLARMAAYGVTTVAAMSADAAEVETVLALEARRTLPTRLRFYVRPEELAGIDRLRSGLAPTPHTVAGLKIVTDGSLGARTAWLSEPYDDAPGEHGTPVRRADDIADLLVEASRLGLQPALHAIGDRAVHRVLRLLGAHSSAASVPRIEHASLVPPPLFRLLEHVRPVLVVQPGFVASDVWIPQRLGASRARWAYAWRTLSERGLILAGSSDAPYDAPDPWKAMAIANAPRASSGRGLPRPNESLSVASVVEMYTKGGARALDEPTLGTLEPGAWGDVTVLATSHLEDALAVGADSVRSTWREGRNVYEAGSGPGRR